jgi:ABC-type Zn uptake system ZnuABC Zn-binding protein ZnuA
MKRSLRFYVVMLALILLGPASPVWGSGPARVPVVVSIMPLVDFVRNVGGDRIHLTALVPPGTSPHTYEPTPALVRAMAESKVLILNGIGLEFWAEKLIRAADNPDLIVVETAEGIEILEEEGEGKKRAKETDQIHDHKKGNPHVWLDPIHAIHQVERIREALSQADPEGADIYRKNADGYIAQLRLLDREIRETVETFQSRKVIAFHAAYTYFMHRYGLELVAVVERTPGREPSPKEIAAIVRAARESRIRAIFAEPQFPSKAAEVIARECGAEVLFLNPLGDPPGFVYLDTMRKNLQQLEKALGGGG